MEREIRREPEIKSEEKEEFTSKDVEKSLQSLSKEDWETANWPLVTFVSRDIVAEIDRGLRNFVPFWEEVFNSKNFIYPGVKSKNSYDSEKHTLYILHSFSKPRGKDFIFKAITTNPKDWLGRPKSMINYIFHGEGCERRSGGASFYPTCSDFWEDFYDKLPEVKQYKYPMPSSPWRKKFVLEKYFGK